MNNKQNMQFIRTSSVEARLKLKELGFPELLTQDANNYVFMNNTTLKFAEKDLPEEIIYTNIINL